MSFNLLESSSLDKNLLNSSLTYHGMELINLFKEENLNLNGDKPNVFSSKGKGDFETSIKEFIVKKADILFSPTDLSKCSSSTGIYHHESLDMTSLDFQENYVNMPPLEVFMDVPNSLLKEHFIKILEKGNILIGTISSIVDTGFYVNLLSVEVGKLRMIHHLKIMAFCPIREVDKIKDHESTLDSFTPKDKVRAVFLKIHEGLIILSLQERYLPKPYKSFKLGIIMDEDIPLSYSRSLKCEGKSYSEVLKKSFEFENPSNIANLACIFGLTNLNIRPSLMRGLYRVTYELDDYAYTLRRTQAGKLAMKSVTEAVKHFKAERNLEAMQLLNKALEIDPENTEGLVVRGALFANSGSYKKAIDDFEMALKFNPSHSNAKKYLIRTLISHSRILLENKNFSSALKYVEWALSICRKSKSPRKYEVKNDRSKEFEDEHYQTSSKKYDKNVFDDDDIGSEYIDEANKLIYEIKENSRKFPYLSSDNLDRKDKIDGHRRRESMEDVRNKYRQKLEDVDLIDRNLRLFQNDHTETEFGPVLPPIIEIKKIPIASKSKYKESNLNVILNAEFKKTIEKLKKNSSSSSCCSSSSAFTNLTKSSSSTSSSASTNFIKSSFSSNDLNLKNNLNRKLVINAAPEIKKNSKHHKKNKLSEIGELNYNFTSFDKIYSQTYSSDKNSFSSSDRLKNKVKLKHNSSKQIKKVNKNTSSTDSNIEKDSDIKKDVFLDNATIIKVKEKHSDLSTNNFQLKENFNNNNYWNSEDNLNLNKTSSMNCNQVSIFENVYKSDKDAFIDNNIFDNIYNKIDSKNWSEINLKKNKLYDNLKKFMSAKNHSGIKFDELSNYTRSSRSSSNCSLKRKKSKSINFEDPKINIHLEKEVCIKYKNDKDFLKEKKYCHHIETRNDRFFEKNKYKVLKSNNSNTSRDSRFEKGVNQYENKHSISSDTTDNSYEKESTKNDYKTNINRKNRPYEKLERDCSLDNNLYKYKNIESFKKNTRKIGFDEYNNITSKEKNYYNEYILTKIDSKLEKNKLMFKNQRKYYGKNTRLNKYDIFSKSHKDDKRLLQNSISYDNKHSTKKKLRFHNEEEIKNKKFLNESHVRSNKKKSRKIRDEEKNDDNVKFKTPEESLEDMESFLKELKSKKKSIDTKL